MYDVVQFGLDYPKGMALEKAIKTAMGMLSPWEPKGFDLVDSKKDFERQNGGTLQIFLKKKSFWTMLEKKGFWEKKRNGVTLVAETY